MLFKQWHLVLKQTDLEAFYSSPELETYFYTYSRVLWWFNLKMVSTLKHVMREVDYCQRVQSKNLLLIRITDTKILICDLSKQRISWTEEKHWRNTEYKTKEGWNWNNFV